MTFPVIALQVIAGRAGRELADQAAKGPTSNFQWRDYSLEVDEEEKDGNVVAGAVAILGIACAILAIAGLLVRLI